LPFWLLWQAGGLMHKEASWEGIQQCIHGRGARGETMLIFFDNAEDVYSSLDLAQVAPYSRQSCTIFNRGGVRPQCTIRLCAAYLWFCYGA
jgi:hypothetical protein